MPTAFCQATKSSVPYILTAILRWVILFRERHQLTLLATRIISRVSFVNIYGFKNKKEARIIVAGANRGSQWGGSFYGYRLKFWLFYGYRLFFFSYG